MFVERRNGGRWGEWWWPANDVGAWQWLLHESDLPSRVVKHVDNFHTCIHAGAHAGFYAKQYAGLFKRVYAVEPQGTNFHCLVNNVDEFNVIKIQACLSNERHMVSLYTADATNSGGYFVCPGDDFLCIKMDDLIGDVGLIHLDVEGHEMLALQGGENILTTYSPVVVLETIPNYDHEPAEKYLQQFGYEIVERLPHDTIYKRYT